MLPNHEFHHIGIACRNLDREQQAFAAFGYVPEGQDFEDPMQGIRGRFLTGTGPRLELVAPLAKDGVLKDWLGRGVKFYHMAYLVDNMTLSLADAVQSRGKVIVAPVPAVAFGGKKISFIMMPNMLLIEFIER